MGTMASYHGNVPYSQAVNNEFPDPVFDSQVSIFNSLIQLLDSGIADLNSGGSRSLGEDIYFGGDADKWISAANTLKARFYMYLRNYSSAYSAAQNGISDPADDLLYRPTGEDGVAGTKNTFWEIVNGSRAGDMGSRNAFMESLLDPNNADSRNHAKTDETARANYYTISDNSASANLGVINENEPMPIITFRENHLILAEAGFRSQGASVGLQRLNEFRAYLSNGGWINSNFSGDPLRYEAFVMDDFACQAALKIRTISTKIGLCCARLWRRSMCQAICRSCRSMIFAAGVKGIVTSHRRYPGIPLQHPLCPNVCRIPATNSLLMLMRRIRSPVFLPKQR
jgi:hypothetical protein